MTLQQVKAFIIGVLKGWFTNKAVLDKLDINDEGNLTYDGTVVDATETYTDEQVTEAVTEALAELNAAPTGKDEEE
jgi:hypothetical protein